MIELFRILTFSCLKLMSEGLQLVFDLIYGRICLGNYLRILLDDRLNLWFEFSFMKPLRTKDFPELRSSFPEAVPETTKTALPAHFFFPILKALPRVTPASSLENACQAVTNAFTLLGSEAGWVAR